MVTIGRNCTMLNASGVTAHLAGDAQRPEYVQQSTDGAFKDAYTKVPLYE